MPLVSYHLEGGIATLTMDDGKRNALSTEMLTAIREAFDRARADGAAVILTGREGVFSAGFDLKLIRSGRLEALSMLKAGFEITPHILSHPRPVVAACNGHALAMGLFLLLSCDYRVGVRGPYKLGANEVAIGIPMPRTGVEMCRLRMTPSYFQRATILGEVFDPESSLAGGLVDRLVEEPELASTARSVAESLLALHAASHVETKLRVREVPLEALRRAARADLAEIAVRGVQRMVSSRLSGAGKPGVGS